MTRRTALACASALTGALALGACSASGSAGDGGDTSRGPRLEVSGAYVPQPVLDDMAGGFLTVRNSGGRDDTLTRVTSDVAGTVELHRTAGRQMRKVDSLPVPAGGTLELSRGGNHLMLRDLKRKPEEGEKVKLELHFGTHHPIEVSVPVMATHHTHDAGK